MVLSGTDIPIWVNNRLIIRRVRTHGNRCAFLRRDCIIIFAAVKLSEYYCERNRIDPVGVMPLIVKIMFSGVLWVSGNIVLLLSSPPFMVIEDDGVGEADGHA